MQSHGHQLVTEHHDEQGQNHHQKHDHRVEGCYDAHQKIISLLLHVIYHVEPRIKAITPLAADHMVAMIAMDRIPADLSYTSEIRLSASGST